MLARSPTTKTTVGPIRLKPSDLPSAVAHTASKTPESTSTIQDHMITGSDHLLRVRKETRSKRTTGQGLVNAPLPPFASVARGKAAGLT